MDSYTPPRADGSVEHEQYRYPTPGEGNRLLGTVDTVSGLRSDIDYNAAGSPESLSVTDRRIEYNAEQRPVSVYEQGQLLAEYRYNAFGERIAKVIHASTGTPTITYFLHDGNRLSAEIASDGFILGQYIYLDDQRPVLKLGGEQVFAIHGDHLGTPRLMSAAEGDVVWEANYDPFGAATLVIADEALNLRLPGQYFDAETDTHYNRYRDYDPATGRYLTSDPIGLEGGINTYAYAEGLPTMYSDVMGLSTDPDAAPAIQKPDASFASKLEYVMEHVAQRLTDEGTKAVFEKFKEDLVGAAVVMGGIAAAAGVALGTAAAVSGGAALPVAVGALASAASAVGVAALWATGFEGVKFLYDIISIGVSIYGTPHTDCTSLKRSADEMFDKITNLAGGVLSNVTTFGIGKVISKLSNVFKLPNVHGRCSFDGDTQVLSRDGYKPIRDIEAGRDQVWSRSEQTGQSGWKGVLAQYSNTYEETVRTTVKDNKGAEHTLISNRIHPFFARVAAGVLLTVAAEGHVYAGEIENGAWVDAQHLQAGDELLGSDGQWQSVVDSEIESVELDAYNLTVDGYSTYYVSGDGSAAGVWVHNVCFDSKPGYFSERAPDTEFGHPVWKDPDSGEEVYEAWDHLTQKNRYYSRKDHPPSPRPTGLIGVEFENFLKNKLGGEGSFSSGGREFDGRIDNRWYEAKSGRYWQDQAAPGPGFDKFKSDMGSRLAVARSNGASYELHSNTPIPDHVKAWLTSKGIPFFEHY